MGPVYQFSEDVAKNRQAIATSLFDFLIEVKESARNELVNQDTAPKSNKELIVKMREKLSHSKKRSLVYA